MSRVPTDPQALQVHTFLTDLLCRLPALCPNFPPGEVCVKVTRFTGGPGHILVHFAGIAPGEGALVGFNGILGYRDGAWECLPLAYVTAREAGPWDAVFAPAETPTPYMIDQLEQLS